MKKIEIRFVQKSTTGGKNYYLLQYLKSGLFKDSWVVVGYNRGAGFGDSVWMEHTDESKDVLLQHALDHYFKMPKARVVIWEHPTLIQHL